MAITNEQGVDRGPKFAETLIIHSDCELPRPKGKRLSVFKEGASGFIKSKQFSN